MIKCNPGGESARIQALYKYDVLDSAQEEAFDRITRLAKTVLQMPIAMVSLVDKDRIWFKSRQNVPVPESPRDGSFCTHTIQHTEPFIVTDASADPLFADNPVVSGEPGIRFYIGVPLRTREGHNLGSLCTLDTKVRTLTPEQIDLLKDLARLVVDELELRLVAATDSLTGAMSRRHFLEEANRDFASAQRHRRPLSCILIDMDRFKSINDSYGHGTGDLVLQHLVSLCKATLRASDYVGRPGGEEFMIMLPETPVNDAFDVAERLRNALAASVIRVPAGNINATASLGVAGLTEDHGSVDRLFKDVDTAMYAAKLYGRNRTVIYDSKLGDPVSNRDPLRLSA
ncbi:MAG: sensor domain-containing diguanylate cyclase [Xanthobacteraceae bacterium]